MNKIKEYILIGIMILLGIILIFFIYNNFSEDETITGDNQSILPNENLEEINSEVDNQKFINAKLTLNENYCNEIDNEELKGECIKEINRSKTFLDAIESDDIELCNVFEDNILIWCQDYYYMAKSSEFNDYQYCDLVQDENRRKDCYM